MSEHTAEIDAPTYKGQVFWHGWAPDRSKTGRVVRRGSLRHEVRWDGDTETTLVSPVSLMLVSRYPKCCDYCASSVIPLAVVNR